MADKLENMYTGIVEVEGDIHIDPALVSRSVYITGYKPTTKSHDLVIHFQRCKNGGGDIDTIVISKRGAAVITFDNPEGKMFMVHSCFRFIFRKLKPLIATLRYERSMFNHCVTCLETEYAV